MSIFTKKPKMTGKVWQMNDHKGWGNNIEWLDYESRKIVGHTFTRPKEGDELISEMQSGKKVRYALINLEYIHDPNDMWFATAYDIGYVGETPINKVKEFRL